MSNPGKYLNLENIIRKVFDHTTDSLRMSSSGAPVGIIISSSDDSIAIGNVAGDLLTINPDGSLNSNINGVTPVLGRIPVDIGGATVNITGPVNITNEVEIKNDAGSPIPVNGTVTVSGVSTLAEQQAQTLKLNTIDASLLNIDIDTSAIFTESQAHTVLLNSIDSKLTSPLSITGSTVALDATTLAALENTNVTISNASIAVTGPLTDVQLRASAVPVSVSGVSTLAEQQTQTTLLTSIDAEVQSINASLDTQLSNVATEATLSAVDVKVNTTNTKLDSLLTELQLKADLTETQPISVSTLPLPTGAATSANQVTANSSLSSIDTKLNNLDIRDLAFATDKVDVTGSIVGLDSTSLAALENITATVSGDINLSTSTLAALENVSIDNFPASQAVTGSFLTDAQLRASAVPVSLTSTTITNFPVTQAVSGTVTANLGTIAGVATETTLAALNTKTPALGQAAMVASQPVVISSDQSSIPVTGTFFQATQPISASTLPLPTGAATSTLQTTGNASLATIDTSTDAINNKIFTRLLSSAPVSTDNSISTTTIIHGLNSAGGGSYVPAKVSPSGALISDVTGTVTANIGTTNGLNLESTQSALNAKVPTGLTVTSGRLQVELPAGGGGLTDTELRASPVPVSATNLDIRDLLFATDKVDVTGSSVSITGTPAVTLTSTTISNFPATQAISATTLPLPTGASTDALQTTIDVSINSLLKPASTLAAVTTVGSVTSITNALPTGTNSIGQVTANAGTNLNTSALNLETTQADIRTSVQLIDNSIGTVAPGAAGTGSNLTGGVFNTTLTTLTNGQQVATQVDNKGRFLNATSNGRLSYTLTAGTNAAGFAAGATANQDIFRISGSATKTVYIKKIRVSATANATQGNNIAIVKRSAANTGGTSVASTLVPLDSTSAASTASAVHYTAAPTSGASVGTVRAAKFVIPTITSLYNPQVIFEFNENNSNPMVLNGTAQGLGIILNTAPGAGNNFLINIEWDEE
jgi:hypothetical protein